PGIQKVALYEPPLTTDHSSPTTWVPRYEREVAAGKLASALVTVIKGTQDSSVFAFVPRFVLVPLMKLASRSDATQVQGDDVPIAALIPTMRFDVKLVRESEGSLERFRGMRPQVLLLGGSKSARFLRDALDALHAVLPEAKRVELKGLGHVAADNGGR